MIINSKADWAQNRGHASAAHNSIWHCLKMLAVFEAVKVELEGFDVDTVAEGQNDFYVFMQALYEDIYAEPDRYAIPTTPYDEYMQNEGANFVSDEHKIDAKENRLRQAFQQAIHFYPDYFYQLGLAADGICKESYALMISKAKYAVVLKGLDNTHTRKHNRQRLEALVAKGIEVKESGDVCYISCKEAPKMFLGLWVLCAAPDGDFKYLNYLRLSFKGYYGPRLISRKSN